MTKEQILESLKSLILKIRDNGDDLLNDPIFSTKAFSLDNSKGAC